eukprot:scaffold1102_cov147-Amphora_coffeaeformis.AAC.5
MRLPVQKCHSRDVIPGRHAVALELAQGISHCEIIKKKLNENGCQHTAMVTSCFWLGGTMSVKLPMLRIVLSHCIVLVICFQLGVFVSYDHGSWCNCDESDSSSAASSSSASSPHHGDAAADWWTRHGSIDGRLPPPFSVARVAAEAMRFVLLGDKEDVRSQTFKEEALVIRLSHDNEDYLPSTASMHTNLTPSGALQGCPSVKILYQDFVEDNCLLVASYEESYHVYRYQRDGSVDGVYQPITRIQNRHLFHSSLPVESFIWAQLFITIQDNISSNLQQLLDQTEHSPPLTVLLLVVDKDTIQAVPKVLSVLCPEEEKTLKTLLWCVDPETHQVAQQLSFPSYYHAEWSRTSLERLPEFSFLVAKILAVQQLLLLKYNVVVIRVVPLDEQSPQSLPIPSTTDWRGTKADVRFLTTPLQQDMRAPLSSMFESPIYMVKSTVSTKALWSKLALSLDLLAKEDGMTSLDEIVSEYVSLFGISVTTTELEEFMLGQTQATCP